jgi:hypothetical protein
MYLLHFKYEIFSLKIFLLFSFAVLVIVDQEFYLDKVFQIYFYLDIFDKVIYIHSEIMYALVVTHLTLLANLKKFDKVWGIMDKKILGK